MHPWNLTVDEAEVLQESLAEDCILEGDPAVETVAAVDISMNPDSELGFISVVLYSLERETVLRDIVLLGDLTFPYVPGLLAFREAPLMMQALMLLDREPDCLLVDGHGYAHPRRFGLASHLGLLMELPSIGCAKSLLVGEYDQPGDRQGSFSDIWDGEPIGYAFRSREECNPIFLSPGHRISRENILPLIRNLIDGDTKLPVPLHRADSQAKSQRERLETLTEPFFSHGAGIFLVGGALRDLLSGKKPSDYDLLVTEFNESIKDELERNYNASFFEMDEERQVYRLMSDELQLDVARVDEDEVVEDLMRRDFTINSIGLDMNRENWVDPRSGREDINQGRIRPTDDRSLWDDPVRLLRAFRFARELDFTITDEVLDEIKEVAPRLDLVSDERIIDELFKIMSLDDTIECLQDMKEEGLLKEVSFFRHAVVDDVKLFKRWVPVMEGYELFSGTFHGGFSLFDGLQVGRLIKASTLSGWPLHHRIKAITKASYEGLKDVPEFEVLNQSRWKLVGRLLGRGLENDWSSHRMGEAMSRLQRYLRDRDLLAKEIVNAVRNGDEEIGSIGDKKKEKLRDELPGLWENRLTPILLTSSPITSTETD
jgi:deoxyribonuclease V